MNVVQGDRKAVSLGRFRVIAGFKCSGIGPLRDFRSTVNSCVRSKVHIRREVDLNGIFLIAFKDRKFDEYEIN